jgi:hypothetical protein
MSQCRSPNLQLSLHVTRTALVFIMQLENAPWQLLFRWVWAAAALLSAAQPLLRRHRFMAEMAHPIVSAGTAVTCKSTYFG